MLYPKPAFKALMDRDPASLRSIWEYLRGLGVEELTGQGRVYGGGLYKLKPKELRSLPLRRREQDVQHTVSVPVQTNLFSLLAFPSLQLASLGAESDADTLCVHVMKRNGATVSGEGRGRLFSVWPPSHPSPPAQHDHILVSPYSSSPIISTSSIWRWSPFQTWKNISKAAPWSSIGSEAVSTNQRFSRSRPILR